MLKGIDPLLGPDLLHALRSAGHGDVVVVADANFPAESMAGPTPLGTALRLDGVDAPRAVRAVLSVLPLDDSDRAAARMQVGTDPGALRPIHSEVQAEVDAAEGRPRPLVAVERFAFYDLARSAYAVVATGDRRHYGCFAFTVGGLPEAG